MTDFRGPPISTKTLKKHCWSTDSETATLQFCLLTRSCCFVNVGRELIASICRIFWIIYLSSIEIAIASASPLDSVRLSHGNYLAGYAASSWQ